MPFLGLNYAPPNPITSLVQADRLALARAAAAAEPQKNYMSGLLGLGADDPYTGSEVLYSPEFTKGTFWDTSKAARRPLVTQVRVGSSSGPVRPAVWDGKKYNVDLAAKIIATAKRRREYDNQKYLAYTNRSVGEKPFSGDAYHAYDPCSLGSMVDEMSGLGASAQSAFPVTEAQLRQAWRQDKRATAAAVRKERMAARYAQRHGLTSRPMSGMGDAAVDKLVQADRIALDRANSDWPKTTMLGSLINELSGLFGLREELGHEDDRDENFPGLTGLGATASPYRQGSLQWWKWYATVYLPQYYSQQQIYQYVQQSPYYSYFGNPFSYPIPYQYGYGYQQPQINYGYGNTGYPSYNQYGQLIDPYSQAQYTQYVGEQGSAACAAGGGYYDYAQQTCNYVNSYPYGGSSYGTVQSYGPGSSPPNVVGMPYAQAVSLLNQYGFNVWLLNLNGISQGIPPGYSQNRVSISVKNGVVDSSAVG